jgi:tRNA acetyltransferase TAN1
MAPPYKPSASSAPQGRKRYLEKSQKSRRIQRNPPRGAPGILMTCETSRERKCQNEGLEILRYYFDSHEKAAGAGTEGEANSESAAPVESEKTQTLEEEIEALKQANKKPAADDPFGVYETGCRGTVFVLCTLPGCPLIPPIQPTRIDGTLHVKKGAAGNEEGEAPAKKPRLEGDDSTAQKDDTDTVEETPVPHASIANPVWDPLDSVRSIVQDLERSVSSPNTASLAGIPSSRYVTRMIPIQATCFASVEEIQQTVRALLDQVLEGLPAKAKSTEASTLSPPTFCVQVKRRNCGHVTRQQIIDTVVTVVDQATKVEPWTVNLRQPDYTVWIEICKTLTGVSILPSSVQNMSRNFNLAEIRERVGVAAE